jgi:hypothetical protein
MAVAAYTAVLVALGATLLTRGSDGAPPQPRHHTRPASIRPPAPVPLHIDLQGAGDGTVAVLGGERCSGDCTIGITRGRVLTLTAAAPKGSRFGGWTAPPACRRTVTCDLQVRGEMTVAARFSAATTRHRTVTVHPVKTVVLTTALTGHGRLAVRGRDACRHGCTFRRGARARLRVTHRAHARVKWSGADCAGDTCTVRLTRARTVTAAISDPPRLVQIWHAPDQTDEAAMTPAPDHALDVRTSPGGSVRIAAVRCQGAAPCPDQYVLELVAVPDAGAAFAGWAGCPEAQGPICELVTGSDRAVTARFTPPPGA